MYEIHMEKLKPGSPSLPIMGMKSHVVMEPTRKYEVFLADTEEEAKHLARSLIFDGPFTIDSILEVPDGTGQRRKYTLTPEEADARVNEKILADIRRVKERDEKSAQD
jgi:hypothetical protein